MNRPLHGMSESEAIDDQTGPVMDEAEHAACLAAVDEGIASLEAGFYVDGEEMEAWALSLFTQGELPLPQVRRRHRP